MNFIRKLYFIFIIFTFVGNNTFCQTGIWLKLEAEKAITKKLEFGLSVQARFNELKGPADKYLVDTGIKYGFNKNIWAGIYYRHISDSKKSGYKTLHRFYGDFGYKLRAFNPIAIDFRFRYQEQFNDDDVGLISDKNYVRNKIGITYKNKSKFEPNLSADLFYRVGSKFDQIRYKATIEYNFTKKQNIEIGYQIDDEINSQKTSRNRITAGYKISF